MQKSINYWISRSAILITLSSILVGCATRTTPAPIVNVTAAPPPPTNPSIATAVPPANAVNGNAIPQQNSSAPSLGVANPNNPVTATQVNGQPLPGAGVPNPTNPNSNMSSGNAASGWIMPTDGNVTQMFTTATKGVDFTGSVGQPIYAVADGKVLYSGSKLAEYGNLIIIRHDGGYLSAYSHNKNNLVNEGSYVKRGQKIATMGVGKNQEPLLHFEVRKSGKPMDPLLIIK